MLTVFAVIPLVWQGAEVSQRRRWRSICYSVPPAIHIYYPRILSNVQNDI